MPPGSGIARNELIPRLNTLKQKHWIRACKRLSEKYTNFELQTSGGRGSHVVFRNTDYPSYDTQSVIVTIQKGLYPLANRQKFECLLSHGIDEDDIWKALKIL